VIRKPLIAALLAAFFVTVYALIVGGVGLNRQLIERRRRPSFR
jgi:hypothetical protein